MAAVKESSKRKSGSGDRDRRGGKDGPASFKKHKSSHGKDTGKKSAAPPTAESLSSSAQKRQVRKDRQSHRRHADAVVDAKSLWNKLRQKSNTKQDTADLMEQVMTLIRGKVNEIALQHDASRVVQAAVQFGSEEQRKELLTEICQTEGNLVELAKIQYAHFCCLKFIKYCARDEASIKLIVKSFKGEMPKLAVHGVAAKVVEFLFLNLPPRATAPLRQEFYGPHFSLFAQEMPGGNTTTTLKTNLENATTETQKEGALKFVKDILNKGMTKSFYGYTYFQHLFAEYIDVAEPSEIRAMASNIADHALHLLSTRAGTKVVAACASYGTPKDRKRICKSLKGYATSSLLHRDAYLALLRLIQVTDDTVSIHKGVLNEILTSPVSKDQPMEDGDKTDNALLNLALSDTGSKLFLMLLVKDFEARMKYFDPYERSILAPVAMIRENGEDVPTSKKDTEIKRQELLKHISDALINMCTENTDTLLTSLPGSRVLKEVYAAFPSDNLVNAIVNVCEASLDAKNIGEENKTETNESKTFSLFEDPIGHRSIKNLIIQDTGSAKPDFSKALVEKLGHRLGEVAASNRGAFVAGSLFKVDSVKVSAKKALKSHLKVIKGKSKGKGSTAGYEALLKEMADK